MDFPLLSVLKSKKDACMADLMDSFSLEGPLVEIPGAEELQPSLEQLMLPIHRAEDYVMVRGEIMEKRLSLMDVVVPLAEPLSSKSLIGKASTSAISATAGPINTLSTTFASSGVVPPLSVSDYQVLDAEPHHEDPPFITFKEEELDTTLEIFPWQSLSLYAPFPNASVTSYGPSHLGSSLPPSSAWLASLFW
ncbi:hypothetical protein Tco_1425768 [Tanacetum coccineum]